METTERGRYGALFHRFLRIWVGMAVHPHRGHSAKAGVDSLRVGLHAADSVLSGAVDMVVLYSEQAKADGASPGDEVEAAKARFAALRPEGRVSGGDRRCDWRPVHAPGAPGSRPTFRRTGGSSGIPPLSAEKDGTARRLGGGRQLSRGRSRPKPATRRPVRRRSGRPVSVVQADPGMPAQGPRRQGNFVRSGMSVLFTIFGGVSPSSVSRTQAARAALSLLDRRCTACIQAESARPRSPRLNQRHGARRLCLQDAERKRRSAGVRMDGVEVLVARDLDLIGWIGRLRGKDVIMGWRSDGGVGRNARRKNRGRCPNCGTMATIRTFRSGRSTV